MPIQCDAWKIVSAYRKCAENIDIGQIPLFLIDGALDKLALQKAQKIIEQKVVVAICRPYDIKIKKQYCDLQKRLTGWGFMDGDEIKQVFRDDRKRSLAAGMNLFGEVEEYDAAKSAYQTAASIAPVDANTGNQITGDLNEYLFHAARRLYPLGVESVLKENIKQSAIIKQQHYLDGLHDALPPKGVCKRDRTNYQITLFDEGAGIDDSISDLQAYVADRIKGVGAVNLSELLAHCAEIGLYRNNATLYAIGNALRELNDGKAIFFDGVACWRFGMVDISSWILRVYDVMRPVMIKGKLVKLSRKVDAAAVYTDNTDLKDRIYDIFDIEPPDRSELDTLGFAITMMGKWVTDNLRYPIAFTDPQLCDLFAARCVYGTDLKQYDKHFSVARCDEIKTLLPHADEIAREKIIASVGFDPEKREHCFSRLPNGHYMPMLYSADEYLTEIVKELPAWMIANVESATSQLPTPA